MKFEVKNRFSGKVQFTAEIDCDADTSRSLKLGLAVRWAIKNNASLRDADLRGADLRGANLRGADLRDVPVVKDIHRKVYESAMVEGAFDMDRWGITDGTCGTTMCRAGHVCSVAGPEGLKLSAEIGVPNAALAIYAASDPDYFGRDGVPYFYCDNETALVDMRRLAELQA